jgi:hypothetical protein
MKIPKWAIIAKNEYWIHLSSIRKVRPHFPYIVISLLAVYVVYIAPKIVNTFIDSFIIFILSQVAIAVVEIILFIVFCYFIIMTISSVLREEHTDQIYILCKAPIKPSDVLLGTFLGVMPFYAILITVIIGLFTALLLPLGLNWIQIGIIIMIFIIISLSAFWIGTVIAALLRTKLERTMRGRDIGRGLALLFALPVVGLYLALTYGNLLENLLDPGTRGIVRTLLSLLPSSWGADIIVRFALNPGTMEAVWSETVAKCGGLWGFFIGALWLGKKAANRAYSLESHSLIGLQAGSDGIFYDTIKFLGGNGSLGILLVSVFKNFTRNLENLLFMTYILGVLILMIIFVGPQSSTGLDGPPVALLMILVMFPFIVVMLSGDVTIKGRETLFIYRKSPSGEKKYINTMVLKNWLIVVPLAGIMTSILTWLTMDIDPIILLATTGLMMMYIAAFSVFVLGLILLNPVYSTKSIKFFINIFLAVAASIGLLFISLFILMRSGEPIGGLLGVQIIQVLLSCLLGSIFFYLGKKKLCRME